MKAICKTCGHPIHWADYGTENGGLWYHDDTVDVLTCPADVVEPVEA